jgi:hypothetical protein
MQPIYFEGSKEIGKPENATDEQCYSLWAQPVDFVQKGADGLDYVHTMWVQHWMPSKEDLEAMNAGRGFWLQIHCGKGLVPIAVFTLDENNNSNDAN